MRITNGIYRTIEITLNTSNGYTPHFSLTLNYIASPLYIKNKFENNDKVKRAFHIDIDEGDKSHYNKLGDKLMWTNRDGELTILSDKITDIENITLYEILSNIFKSIDDVIADGTLK